MISFSLKNKCVKDVYDDLAVYISYIVYNCAGSLFFYFFLNLFSRKKRQYVDPSDKTVRECTPPKTTYISTSTLPFFGIK